MMASADLSKRVQFTYIWTIENISRLTQIRVKSPYFVARSVSKVRWYLEIEELLHICCCLRSEDARHELPSEINFEFSILSNDGSPLISKRSDKHTFCIFLLKKEAFMERCSEFISNNTLTIKFRMWKNVLLFPTADLSIARTKLEVHTKSFIWSIENFNGLNSTTEKEFGKFTSDERRIYPLRNFTQIRHFMFLILYLQRNPESEDVCVDFLIEKGTDYAYKCEIALLDANGNVIVSKVEGSCTHFRRKILNFWNLTSKSKLIGDKNLFLPINTLYLRCSFEVCTGVASSEIEYSTPDASLVVKEKEILDVKVPTIREELLQIEESIFEYMNENVLTENSAEETMHSDSCNKSCPLKDALKYLHCEELLSDVSLKIGKKLYHVHKNILSSRSSVFKAIFSKSVEDNIFEIHDMDENTLHRLLQYIYSDTVDNLQFEHALDLYKGAAEYQLFDLRNKCSDSLLLNLSEDNVFDILSLTEKYPDEKLEMVARNGFKDKSAKYLMASSSKADDPDILSLRSSSLTNEYQDKKLEVVDSVDSGKEMNVDEDTKEVRKCNLL